jgi:hypothetical protein
MTEERMREAIRGFRAPDEQGASERAWRLVQAAQESASPGPPPGRRSRRRAIQTAVALGLLIAVAISPAGAAVTDWVGDTVENGHEPSLPALTSLPAPGPLLVDSARGAWVVNEDGSKRLLGAYRQSTWSPRGLFLAAVGANELVALDPQGEVRWTLARQGALSDPAWSPDGYRIGYLNDGALRVVAGDGTGDHEAWPRAAPVTPAWRPGPGHALTFADPAGPLRTIDVDSGESIFATSSDLRPTKLEWSRDGSRLLVAGRSGIELLDRRGGLLWRRSAPPGMELGAATLALGGDRVAAIVTARGRPRRGELLLLGPAGSSTRLFSGPGLFSGISASADGRWLLLEWRSADQWLFLDLARPQQVVAVSDIGAQFAPGTTSPSSFPRVAGWCCQGPPPAPAP